VPFAASAPPTVPTPLLTPSPPTTRTEPPVARRPPGPEAGLAHDDILSKLKLTVHVYAEQPTDRLVFINGAKYVQGDRIDGKVLLEEITQDGAVVSFEGRRVVLTH
jgi:general secretion pathway protein B